MSDTERPNSSCENAADIITAVNRTTYSLLREGDIEGIREVAQRLTKEAGWPEEIVELYIEVAEQGDLF